MSAAEITAVVFGVGGALVAVGKYLLPHIRKLGCIQCRVTPEEQAISALESIAIHLADNREARLVTPRVTPKRERRNSEPPEPCAHLESIAEESIDDGSLARRRVAARATILERWQTTARLVAGSRPDAVDTVRAQRVAPRRVRKDTDGVAAIMRAKRRERADGVA